ncbi:hypothetical protein [Agrococcus citreus]|uniref:NADH:ubiquinone oxidoreductase n=1 Tax=Agrococcus citreus TaxID=84643 RepID=A0ABN1YZ40_9MICO
MRKYLFNPGVLGSIAGAIGVAKATKQGPRDWRLGLLWASWAIGVALALGAVNQREDAIRQDELERELKKAAKRK